MITMPRPQRYHSVDPADIDRYLDDGEWIAEQKLDGVRCVVTMTDGEPVLTTNTGRRMWPASTWPWWDDMIGELRVIAGLEVILDGELFDDGHLWLFDCPFADGYVDPATPFRDRRRALEAVCSFLPDDRVHLVPQFNGEAKRGLWHDVLEGGAEGIVVKDLDGPYRADGGRTRAVLKVKRTYTVDVVVLDTGIDGKDSSLAGLYDDGELVEVGKISMSPDAASVGDVIEVKFLYVDDLAAPKLYQSVFLRRRDDKDPADCEFAQLLDAVPDRSVLAGVTP